MDKKRKNEVTDRKNYKSSTKDRGDLKRNINEKPIKTNAYDKTLEVFLPDRGDTVKKPSTSQNKVKSQVDTKQANETTRFEDVKHSATVTVPVTDKGHSIKKNRDTSDHYNRMHQHLEEKKRIRDKYTLKLRNVNQITEQDKDGIAKIAAKNADRDKQANENSKSTDKHESSYDGQSEHKSDEGSLRTKRKPLINTVTLKNDTRLYKAVTFMDQRRTPLQIKVPNGANGVKKQVSKATHTSLRSKIKATVSRVSIKEHSVRRVEKKHEKECRKKHFTSPDSSVTKTFSPPTEVAKWAPSCINRYTKPYYEAWVNTTLAAISKTSDDTSSEKQKILDSFQRAFERPGTPELVYENFADEKYTGRIKVTQRTS